MTTDGPKGQMSPINARPEIRTVKLSDLKPAPYNPRKIDPAAMAGLEKSLERFGVVEPIIWNERTGFVVGGHQRLKVLRSRKVKDADVVVVSLDAADEKALNVALNSPHITGEFSDRLGALLDEIENDREDLFVALRLGELRAGIEPGDGHAGSDDLDDAPEPPATPLTQLGDVWVLDRHRLVCGDASQPAVLAALLQGEKAGMVFTDPPYGMKLDVNRFANVEKLAGRRRTNYRPVAGDDGDFDPTFLFEHFGRVREMFLWGGDFYAERIPKKNDGGWIVWDKKSETMDTLPGSAFELCWSKTRHKREIVRIQWNGYRAKEQGQRRVHPTQKPIALCEWFLEKYGQDGEIVVDLYGGSGSTLIACEASHRRARLVELDPGYCDVIVRRWEDLTGQKAVREKRRAA
jgi:DNA modification methylase